MIMYTIIQILAAFFALIFFGNMLHKEASNFDKILSLIGWLLSMLLMLFVQGVLKC